MSTWSNNTTMNFGEKQRRSIDEEGSIGGESVAFLQQLRRHDYDVQPPHQRKAHLFITLLSYLAIGCLSVAVYELGRFSVAYPDKTVHLLPGRNLVPYFPHNQVIQFEPNHVYAGNQSSKAWDDLNAEGGGWIAIEDGEKLGLGPPIRYNNKEGYGISVFHQLHCLAAMHDAFIELASGTRGTAVRDPVHIEHCFDYLRQVLMCHADLGLEHRRHEGEGIDNDSTDGWGALHQCRDWNAVVEFVEENALTKGWIPPKGFKHGHHHDHSEPLAG